MAYTKEQIIEKLSVDNAKLYKNAAVNYAGYTSVQEGGEKYTEIIADFILHNLIIPDIEVYQRENYIGQRDKDKKADGEEKLQRDIFNGKVKVNFDFGEFKTFELILHANGKGVDLVSYNKNNNTVYLIELKKADAKDTLLRCVLEIQTYYQKIDNKQLLENLQVPQDANIVKCLLLPKCRALQEYDDKSNKNVINLMNLFNIIVVAI